jgi:hypothetical protein
MLPMPLIWYIPNIKEIKIGYHMALHSLEEAKQLARISHTFSDSSHTLPIEIASQVGEDSVHATRPRPLERQSQSAECASCQRKYEKCGLVAIARKMLVICYHMISSRKSYYDLGTDYLDKLNVEKKKQHHLKQLQKLGYQVYIEVSV